MLFIFSNIEFFNAICLNCLNLIKGNIFYTLLSAFNMNRMKDFNLVYIVKKEKNCEKRCGGSSVNGICFNKI